MKKLIYIFIILCASTFNLTAQKYFTKEGRVSFTSDAPLEKIEGKNQKASSVFDVETGKIEWAVLIKAFQFDKSLMQEHFNENYMESSKFPKATFKGKIDNIETVDFMKDGQYQINVTGQLTIHGVTNDLATTAEFKILNGEVKGASLFKILVADYDIKIPGVVADNIAKEVEISIESDYQLYTRQ